MSLRLVTELAEFDRALLAQAVDGFVPDRVYDIHTHLFHSRHFAPGKKPAFLDDNRGYGMRDYREALARWLPSREVDGLFFGYPSAGNDRAGENAWIAGELAAHPEQRLSRGLALVAPEDGEEATRLLIQERGFAGIKCYRLYAPVADTAQAHIEEFAPEWMWRLCDEMEGVLMLHLMRSQGIADPDNLASITRLCEKYSRCRLVLAHVARSFNYRNARSALHRVARLENVVVDTSAVTETEAMRCALEVLGPRRVLFGSDYMVSELRGKCFTMGDGFSWVYADDLPSPVVTAFDRYTLVGIESLLCLREAFEAGGFNADDARDLFRDNALRLLAPQLPKEDAPETINGPERWRHAKEVISCGTGLMSKRAESFDPQSWPSYFSRCEGSHVWDENGRRLLDFTGGVGAILLGYSDPEVNAAVRRRVSLGSYCTLVSPDEPVLAETLLSLHPWAARVRYARGGGEALGLAVRIARAATGRSGVAFCGYHGWQDWYLAANLSGTSSLEGHLLPGLEPLGVPRELSGTAVPFAYNDLAAFQQALDRLEGRLAAVVMEPFRSEPPQDGFLEKVQAACRARGAVLVIDEVTSGWRFGFPGACASLGIEPDIAVYAKAISNGVPCAAVVGNAEVMDAANASFISSSYWTDGLGAAAALACVRKMQRLPVQSHVTELGGMLQQSLRDVAARHSALQIKVGGQPQAPSLAFQIGADSAAAKALLLRKMLARGVLASTQIYVMWTHTGEEVRRFVAALDEVLSELDSLHRQERLQAEAGPLGTAPGFRRLA